MYYFIEKSKHAPSGIALIISFPKYTKILDASKGYTYYYPENEKVLHDEVSYLGGEVDDLIGNGIDPSQVLTQKKLVSRIFT